MLPRHIARGPCGVPAVLGIQRGPGVVGRSVAPWHCALAGCDRLAGVGGRSGPGDRQRCRGVTSAVLELLGTPREPRNLMACLDRLRTRPELAAQSFRTAGGFGPELTLWPVDLAPARPKVEPLLQRGHADRITAVAFTAAGAQAVATGVDLATASMDSTVRLWRAADRTLLRVLPMVTNGVWSLAKSGDGKLLVAGGGKGDVLFYDVERDAFKTVPGPSSHNGPVDRVAILADGRRVVTLDNKGRSLLWDAGEATVRGLGSPSDASGRLLVAARRPGAVAFALVLRDEARDGDGSRFR